jgi:hypothetical protein
MSITCNIESDKNGNPIAVLIRVLVQPLADQSFTHRQPNAPLPSLRELPELHVKLMKALSGRGRGRGHGSRDGLNSVEAAEALDMDFEAFKSAMRASTRGGAPHALDTLIERSWDRSGGELRRLYRLTADGRRVLAESNP